MRNIYREELEILLQNYDEKLNDILKNEGLTSLLNKSNDELRKIFALEYKTVHYQVKTIYSYKPRNELSYNLLKLKRICALWAKTNVIVVEGGVQYAQTDSYDQFPKFNMQNPTIYPSDKTLDKIRIKAIGSFMEQNETYDLRFLRNMLLHDFGMSNEKTNEYVDAIRRMQAKKVINSFSLDNTNDYDVEVFDKNK